MENNFEKIFYENKNNPYELEKLFHKNKNQFIKLINKEKSINNDQVIQFWDARINYKNSFDLKKMIISIILAVLCWIPLRILIEKEDMEFDKFMTFLPCIFTFTFSLLLSTYDFKIKSIIYIFLISLITGLYLFFIPFNEKSQSIINIYIHIPIFLWSMIGFFYCDFKLKNYQKIFDFLLLSGEMIIWSTLLLISGIILTFITLTLFKMINIEIEDFYFKNIVSLGIIIAPFLSVPILKKFSDFNISSVIAKIFAPLAIITLITYLLFSLITKNVPYENRNILITYNIILVAVLGIIIFINANYVRTSYFFISNFVLISVSTIIDLIALTAIIYRIREYGLTPNKITVLGINFLMLINLIWILISMIKNIHKEKKYENIVNTISKYLPIYSIWSLIVIVIIPIIFKYK